MNKKMQITFVTGSRADYGIMRRYLDLMNQDSNIELGIIATAALLDEKFGHQVDLIYEDGFTVIHEVPVTLNSGSNEQVLNVMAEVMNKFATLFEKEKYDLLIILGDRYEMLSVAIAASMHRIPILHVHGGEATYANYDEFIRHAITKMSLYHFTATEEYKNRVIQLGEHPSKVYNLGALGAENCLFIDEKNVPEEIKQYELKKYFVILFHPETLTNIDVLSQVKELIAAIECFSDYKFVFLGTNADTHSDDIRRTVQDFVMTHDNASYYENLHTDAYHYLLKNAICLIGNSSSGIIEAPSLGIYTINIGNRQKGRVRGNSVLDVICRKEDIKHAMENVLDLYNEIKPINPYYIKDSAKKYYETTKQIILKIEENTLEPKEFYDVDIFK